MDLYKSFLQGKPTVVLSKMLAMMIGKLGGSSLLMYVSNDWFKVIIFLTFFPALSVGGVIYLVVSEGSTGKIPSGISVVSWGCKIKCLVLNICLFPLSPRRTKHT